jgi:hypothetical protein
MGTSMTSSVTRYRGYAADCVQQAQGEESTDERNIMLNVALAWLRLAQQAEALDDGNTQQASGPVDLDDARDDVPASFDQRDLDDRRAERHDLAS